MFINFSSKYSKQQCRLHYKEDERHVLNHVVGEFWNNVVVLTIDLEIFCLEVSDFPMQLSLKFGWFEHV
jgi:hypothetical protein